MSMFSPRFKSAAAMAGWDEETLLSTLVVEDTPERILRDKKRSDLLVISPPTSSRRKRRRARPGSIPIAVFNLDVNDEATNTNLKETEKGKSDLPKKGEEIPKDKEQGNVAAAECSSSSTLPCMDRLRDELSCAICLDICYEPSTTPCGHSFCKKCLKSAADKCGKKCPKCRQLISNGRSCTINTVLWNTIQLLFPAEVEMRKAAADAALSSTVADQRKKSAERMNNTSNEAIDDSSLHMTRRLRVSRRSEEASLSNRRAVPNQDEDAALALRLQREEFMGLYRGPTLARDNLRVVARRAMNIARNRNGR